jgi:hypothetical protein
MVKHTQDPIDAIHMDDQKDMIDTVEDVEQTGKEETRERIIVTEEDVSGVFPSRTPLPTHFFEFCLTVRTDA